MTALLIVLIVIIITVIAFSIDLDNMTSSGRDNSWFSNDDDYDSGSDFDGGDFDD